jgi:hypothetical protein
MIMGVPENPYDVIYDKHGKLKSLYQRVGNYTRRSRCQSKIPNLTIGDVRQIFVQLRMLQTNGQLKSDSVLFNGMTAGHFAIEYIVRNYNNNNNQK